jgi:hypothetical protein
MNANEHPMEVHERLRLGEPVRGTYDMIVGKIGAGPFKNYEEARDQWLLCRRNMHVYPLLGCPETVIKVPEAAPDYPRLTAQEAFAALVELPDLRLVRCVVIVDDVHREEPWRCQSDPHWHLFGEAFADGEIRLYRPTVNDDVSAILKHEWAHLLEFAEPVWRHVFEQVGDLERFTTGNETLDSVDGAEQWAYLGERLLSTAPLLSPATSTANPIRASIWAQALGERLHTLPHELKSAEHRFYECVLEWTKNEARPVALTRLGMLSTNGDVDSARRARSILGVLETL